MGRAFRQLQKKRRAVEKLSDIIENPEHVIVIHYSCESFYDRPDGTSPRITSIAVRNLGSGQTTSFSIHQVAERQGRSSDEIEDHYNDLERKALDEFYDYVSSHVGYRWLHWNMRDINYGFQAIAHRYRVLGGEPVEIPETLLFDLARALVAIYGLGYIGHPRLLKIVEKNKITSKDFLSGADEARTFEEKEYYKLHQSTLRKVDVIANIAERTDQGTLKTNIGFFQRYQLYPRLIGEWLQEHWLPSIIFALIAILGLIFGVITLIR